jgi:hypothetical protein
MEDNVLNRRQVLTGSVIAALAALWKPGEALAEGTPPEAQGATVVYDVSCALETPSRSIYKKRSTSMAGICAA